MSATRPALRCPAGLHGRIACVVAVALLAPAAAFGQPLSGELENLLLEVFDERSSRRQNLESYVEVLRGGTFPGLAGLPGGVGDGCANCIVHQIEEIVTGDGEQAWADRIMSLLEVQAMLGIGMGPELAATFGFGLMAAQSAINTRMPTGMVPSLPDAWIDPHRMLAAGGVMMLSAAQAGLEARQSLATSNAQAQAETNRANQIAVQIEDLGIENTPNGPMNRVGKSGLNQPMDTVDGQQTILNGVSFLIDPQQRVILEHRFDGTMIAEGESRPFFIEVEHSDFRQVPGCDLYEPYKRTMRMGGMLDDEQMAQMEEARVQLAEFEAQLAAMPPQQRAMMEGMMGSQMDTMRNMVNGGAIEHVTETEEILCNPDLRALFSPIDPAIELAQIQRDLVTLGYQPGNTDGVLDVLTEVAISQYQAERGVPVTGQPSTDLALMLSSEAGG
ncbi:MAG: peptidoglycan-binding protein [Gammaproteobacteria bacterium]|nr:peptidoglycan-binding protein [Gammaproteobacteria bacterium]MDH3507508.1 peptidoglycan-binding protein [Gammaproteobacteria bacterium]